MIEFVDVSHNADDGDVLADVSFRVERGESYALLGPSNAGGSTAIDIAAGLVPPGSGTVSVLGLDPHIRSADLSERLGIVVERPDEAPSLTVRELLTARGKTSSPVGDDAQIGFAELLDERVDTLGPRDRRVVEVYGAVIGGPEALVIDQPTRGLSHDDQPAIWTVIERARASGTTILFATSDLDEAQRLADRVGVIDGGRILTDTTPAEILGVAPTTITFELPEGLSAAELSLPATTVVQGASVMIETTEPATVLAPITSVVRARSLELIRFRVHGPTVDGLVASLAARGDVSDGTDPAPSEDLWEPSRWPVGATGSAIVAHGATRPRQV